jgi:arabinogalactan endo-1,4-beta-galactosidase
MPRFNKGDKVTYMLHDGSKHVGYVVDTFRNNIHVSPDPHDFENYAIHMDDVKKYDANYDEIYEHNYPDLIESYENEIDACKNEIDKKRIYADYLREAEVRTRKAQARTAEKELKKILDYPEKYLSQETITNMLHPHRATSRATIFDAHLKGEERGKERKGGNPKIKTKKSKKPKQKKSRKYKK